MALTHLSMAVALLLAALSSHMTIVKLYMGLLQLGKLGNLGCLRSKSRLHSSIVATHGYLGCERRCQLG